ncbi:alpha-1,2-fucosyltransferase [Marinobacter sp.]|uniref:alpha-1,2-fucosyltransferase n=1 Tax=Marinobacter sp. TaxID=50741 RepID=UPI00198CC1B4|nr:alpha-1,2-fucosyltransferase [Marinobacter sp.]MBC7192784.1 alpha-1,2-fucosyltransferase [Marinobacter sp.]
MKLDVSFYAVQNLRKFELDALNIEENNYATLKELKAYRGAERLWFKVARKLQRPLPRPESYYAEKASTVYDPGVFEIEGPTYFDGFWQNERYFSGMKDQLRREFFPRNGLGVVAKNYIEQMKEGHSVSVHVRRGDYVRDQKTNQVHGTCSIEYYRKAIEHIKSSDGRSNFYIFSDDLPWCRVNLDFIPNAIFVDGTESAIEDVILMSACNDFIIANSSFSWWGAWLGEGASSKVISPLHWVKSNPEGKKWVPERWYQI